uniref:Class II aldolase/adducin N-terminal domain-containing protein n=1 Tax=Panagrolaimus sp. JU765 TaxID=591449 RepID=A0AC34Q261_9BILA
MSKITTNITERSRSLSRDRKPIVNLDRDDPEYIKEMQRPAVIKEDLSEMERRKRVQEILDSKDFCRELEQLVKQEALSGRSDPETLKRLTELTLPRGPMACVNLHSSLGLSKSAVPIADLRGNEQYSREEWVLRNKLASLYRLVDLFQWSQGIYNHITVRVHGTEKPEILINPFGLLYHEITASSLIKINLQGDIINNGSTNLGINKAGYVLHSAIHEARPDVKCILHMHTAIVSAVSSMKCGLLPICQEAMIIGPVAYHDYQGIVCDEDEKASLVKDLGDKNVMLLRNHGFVACGESIEDALHLAFHTVIACETQVKAAKAGLENLVIPDEAAVAKAYEIARHGGGGVNKTNTNGESAQNWRIGELEWEAWMRLLDCAGYKTGHIYRQPYLMSRHEIKNSTINNSDVAEPPAAIAIGAVNESDSEAMIAYRLAMLRKEQEKVKWLNSPINYQKIHIYETGTDNPKIITKWVESPSQSQNGTPIKINNLHQFSPLGTDPKEFKEKQKEMKKLRLEGVTTAGPQSAVLDGLTADDINGIQESSTTEPLYKDVVIIGTASKGIIDRQHQHNAQVYGQIYAPNPFSRETDEELEKYLKEVKLKNRSASFNQQPTYVMPESPTPDTASLSQGIRHGMPTKSASMDDEFDHAVNGYGNSTPRSEYQLVTTFDDVTDGYSTVMKEVGLSSPKRDYIEPNNNYMVRPHGAPPPPPKLTVEIIPQTPIRRSMRLFSEFERNNLTSRSEVAPESATLPLDKKKKRKGFFSFVRRKK